MKNLGEFTLIKEKKKLYIYLPTSGLPVFSFFFHFLKRILQIIAVFIRKKKQLINKDFNKLRKKQKYSYGYCLQLKKKTTFFLLAYFITIVNRNNKNNTMFTSCLHFRRKVTLSSTNSHTHTKVPIRTIWKKKYD